MPNNAKKIAKDNRFVTGHDEHVSSHEVIIPYLGIQHTFHIVGEDFPIQEDGIMGLPFLHQYKYNFTNNALYLDKKKHELIDDGIIIPPYSVQLVKFQVRSTNENAVLMNNKYLPDSIYRITDQQIKIPLANPTPEYKTYQVNEFDIRPSKLEFKETPVMYITEQEFFERIQKVLET